MEESQHSSAHARERLQEILVRGQRSVLELMAAGAPLADVLGSLCRIVEELSPRTQCSVLLLTQDELHLRHAAAPSLPEEYCRLIDGIAIGPSMGSCGAAAYARQPVIATDIATDPHWRGYEKLAASFDLAACASTPILSGPDAKLLGTFAIYHRVTGPFAPLEWSVLQSISDLAAIAIVNQKRQDALRARDARLSQISAAAQVIETRLALDGRWLEAPRALCELLGRTEAEILASRLNELLHPSDLQADRQRYARLVRGELDSCELECRLMRKDGAPIWTRLRFVAERDGGGKPARLAVYIADIRQKKQAEEALRASQKLENFTMLVPGLVHDFNNLVTAILCNVTLAQIGVDRASVTGEALETIDALARRAGELTRQSLLPAGQGFKRRPVDLGMLATEITHALRATFLHDVRVELDLSPGLPPTLGDPAQIHQVVMNLVINAAQAIGDGPGTIRLRTSVEELHETNGRTPFLGGPPAPGEYVRLEITDSGAGMTPEVMQRISEPFFTTKVGGHGVGLAVARGILAEHRAGLSVESQVGRGSSFSVWFAASRAQPTAQSPSIRPTEAYWPGARGTVMLMDDDPLVRGPIVRMLHALGCETLEVADGSEALLQLAKRRSDLTLVLLDLASPRAAGHEALPIIRERWPDLKVVVTTDGNVGEVSELEALSGGKVLPKPYGLGDLRRLLFGETRADPAFGAAAPKPA